MSNRDGAAIRRTLRFATIFFDHTLITPVGSVGVIMRERSICIHAESTSYDSIGPDRTTRFEFDSR
jgi:hypothetical protein